jgi:tetratricopeptide (TPR) repeat protein/tRNA A-37 threonylcarbamoyl transferase component Bud32
MSSAAPRKPREVPASQCSVRDASMTAPSHAPLSQLPTEDWQELEKVVAQFEGAWQSSNRPAIEDYLPADSALRTPALVELVRADLENRLKLGEEARVEDYLGRFPALTEDAAVVLVLIATEYRQRRTRQPDLGVQEYFARFPQYAAPILRFLSDPRPSQAEAVTLSTAGKSSAFCHDASTPGFPGPRGAPRRWPELPGYEIIEEIARGGMGVVYRARQIKLNRIVALKVILSGAHASERERAQFQREAEAVARLQHPHIVQIYEIGEQNALPYFSLEYVDGGSLAKKLSGTPVPAKQAAQLTETLARAVQVAHEQGIIHRDLKPGNVLLTSDGTPKIADFGLAKRLDSDTAHSRSGAIIGTPSYMAPEQASGRTKEIGPSVDVYALGAILYELLTARPPFKAPTAWDTVLQVISEEVVPPSRLQTKLARDLETICLKCLQKEPGKRYESAQALADDLRRFLEDQPIVARPVGQWERAWRWSRRNPLVTAASGVAVVALLAATLLSIGFAFTQRQNAALQAQANEDLQRALSEADLQRREFQDYESRARAALKQNQVDEADRLISIALARIGSHEVLRGLKEEGEQLQAEIKNGLEKAKKDRDRQQQDQQARSAVVKFDKLRNEALFHSTLSIDSSANLQATKEATRGALDVLGISLEPGAKPLTGFDASLSDRHEEIKQNCYELLLVLAEAEAGPGDQPETGSQASKALAILKRAADFASPSQIWYRRQARYLERMGDGAGAKDSDGMAERLQPTDVDYYFLGDQLYKDNDLPAAMGYFELALRKQPNRFWAQYFLALCHLRQGQMAEAKTGLTACLQQRSDLVWIYLMRGFAHGQLNEFQAAEEDFTAAEKCERSGDADSVLYANRGVLRLREAEVVEMLASSMYLGCLAPPPVHACALAARAYRTHKSSQAAEDFRKAIALKPDQTLVYVSLASAYQQQNRVDDALQQLTAALKWKKDLPAIYRARARIYEQQGDLRLALDDLDHAVQASEDSQEQARDQVERGRLFQRLEQFNDALSAYREASRSRPGYDKAYLGQAEALLKLKRYEEAVTALDRYLESGGKPLAEVYRARGLARDKLQRYGEAVQDYSRLVELSPRNAAARLARGWTYLACKAYLLAREDFSEALRLDPENRDAYNGRGYALAKLGDVRAAVADAYEALRQNSRDPLFLYQSARIFAVVVGALDAETGGPRENALARREYQDQALDLIIESLSRFPKERRLLFWRETVERDPALNPLHRSARFADLSASYSQR